MSEFEFRKFSRDRQEASDMPDKLTPEQKALEIMKKPGATRRDAQRASGISYKKTGELAKEHKLGPFRQTGRRRVIVTDEQKVFIAEELSKGKTYRKIAASMKEGLGEKVDPTTIGNYLNREHISHPKRGQRRKFPPEGQEQVVRERIKKLGKGSNDSQTKIAKDYGVDQTTVSRYVRGITRQQSRGRKNRS